MNTDSVSYSMRSIANPGREEPSQYDRGSMNMANMDMNNMDMDMSNMDMNNMNMNNMNMNNMNNMNNMDMNMMDMNMMGAGGANYMMNRAVLANPGNPNEYGNDMDNCTADMISQMKMEQAINNFNEQNGSMISQGMNLNMDPSGYESYRNLSNYNNTQNTIKTNHLPMPMSMPMNMNGNMDEYGGEQMYLNQQGMNYYSDQFLKNLPETDNAMMQASNFQMQQGNYNPMGNNYASFQSPLSAYDNLPSQQMFMNPSGPPKQTRNVPLPSGSGNLHPNASQMMQPQMTGQGPTQHLAPNLSMRKNTTLAKRKMKPKKFFPCC